jgi:prefoldin subunit 5
LQRRHGKLNVVNDIEALKKEIATLTQSLYKAYNKINDLQAYIHEEIHTTKEKDKETPGKEE